MSEQPKSKSEMKRLNVAQGRDIAEGVNEFGKSEQSKPINSAVMPQPLATEADYLALSARCAELEQFESDVADLYFAKTEAEKELDKLRAQLSEKERELRAEKVWHGHWKATNQALDELRGKYRTLERELAEVKEAQLATKSHMRKVVLERDRSLEKSAELEKQLYDLKNVEMKLNAAIRERDEYKQVLAEKDADHKLIMASVERQRDLNDRQSAELKLLREDWVRLRSCALFYAADYTYFLVSHDKTVQIEDGPETARKTLADLKYKGE